LRARTLPRPPQRPPFGLLTQLLLALITLALLFRFGAFDPFELTGLELKG
jgi:hypothetical protein